MLCLLVISVARVEDLLFECTLTASASSTALAPAPGDLGGALKHLPLRVSASCLLLCAYLQ